MRDTVILVQPDTEVPYKIVFLPFAPLFLATKLREAGYNVLIFDERVDGCSRLAKMIKNHKVLFVGLSIFTGPNIDKALNLSKYIKNLDPNIPLVWGGPHPTILPEQTAKHPLVDIAVRGEGDVTLPEIAFALKNKKDLKGIKGITFEKGKRIVSTPDREFVDWDKEVSMALDLIDIKKYIFKYNGMKTISIITSRGCPFRCSFCWNLLCNKRRWRGWSMSKIKDAIKPFLDMGVRRFLFEDDFIGGEKRVLELCELFKVLGLEWAIENGGRVDAHNSDRLFKALKESQCTHISYGAESGSQHFLDVIHKDITVGQIIESAEKAAKYDIGVKYSWMVGIPGETRKDVISTIEVIDRVKEENLNSSHSISFFAPYAGTEMYEKAMELGWNPPLSLDGWCSFREEMSYPYLKNIWFYKAVLFTNFFVHAINAKTAIWKQTKKKYLIPFKILSMTSSFRWRKRFFNLPIEYIIITYLWKLLKNKSIL